jgi:hypothetical protein
MKVRGYVYVCYIIDFASFYDFSPVNVGSEYASAVVLGSKDKMNGTEARHWAL